MLLPQSFQSSAYGWLMLAAIGVSLGFWLRLARGDERLILIYVAALAGAFLGAKLVYVAAEGWMHWRDPERWVALATGKSITGALLGGYVGVEVAKRWVGYTRVTGDWFAGITALGIMLGRIGCLAHGCCLGRPMAFSWAAATDATAPSRWPAAGVEFAFNGLMLGALLVLRRKRLLPGQHFHVYLIAYGLFRFAHEFLRETPRLIGPLSGYHVAAVGLVALGAIRFSHRQQALASSVTVEGASQEAIRSEAPGWDQVWRP